MESGGVSANPTLQGGIDPECLFFCVIFRYTHAYDCSIPPLIICVYWSVMLVSGLSRDLHTQHLIFIFLGP